MQPHELPQRGATHWSGKIENSYTNRDPERARNVHAWIVRLNNDNELVVEGSLECGRRAQTKPIAERISASKILSKFKHTYYLVGNMTDSQYELPGFVRHRFHAGFPQDWKSIVEIWKSFVTSECNVGIRSSYKSEELIVEKKLKLAVNGCADSHCFMESPRKDNRVDSETHLTDGNDIIENIDRYWANAKQGGIIAGRNVRQSIMDYEWQDDQRSDTISDVKQLTRWTPLIIPDETGKYCLIFRGTLLSSMGHTVSKNHLTDAVHRRLSARIIETVNQEFYELIGDVNNTKRVIPKELVVRCRYGCPKQIHSFCEKWRILKSDEMKLQKHSPQEESKIGQDLAASLTIRHEKSDDLLKNGGTNLFSVIPVKKEKKRKRIPMELNDNCDNRSCYTSIDNDTTFNEKPGAMFVNDSRIRSWPKVRRKSRTNLPDASGENTDNTEGENVKIIEQLSPTAMHEVKKQPSPLKLVPSLSYVYHRCAPLTESILSDGV